MCPFFFRSLALQHLKQCGVHPELGFQSYRVAQTPRHESITLRPSLSAALALCRTEHLGPLGDHSFRGYLSIGECDPLVAGHEQMYQEAMDVIFKQGKPVHR